jgi:hypothetical protein
MAKQGQSYATDLMAIYKATLFELPLAGVKWGLGIGKEREAAEAAWSGYDAWVRVTTATIDDVYRSSLFGSTIARTLNQTLRWQRLSQAVVSVVSASLWPALGVPTAATVQATYDEVQSLTAQLKVQYAHLRALRAEVHALTCALPAPRTKHTHGVRRNTPRPLIPTEPDGHQVVFAPATAA